MSERMRSIEKFLGFPAYKANVKRKTVAYRYGNKVYKVQDVDG